MNADVSLALDVWHCYENLWVISVEHSIGMRMPDVGVTFLLYLRFIIVIITLVVTLETIT